jgi:hypothetical protein
MGTALEIHNAGRTGRDSDTGTVRVFVMELQAGMSSVYGLFLRYKCPAGWLRASGTPGPFKLQIIVGERAVARCRKLGMYGKDENLGYLLRGVEGLCSP